MHKVNENTETRLAITTETNNIFCHTTIHASNKKVEKQGALTAAIPTLEVNNKNGSISQQAETHLLAMISDVMPNTSHSNNNENNNKKTAEDAIQTNDTLYKLTLDTSKQSKKLPNITGERLQFFKGTKIAFICILLQLTVSFLTFRW